jgi:hypothetical protein
MAVTILIGILSVLFAFLGSKTQNYKYVSISFFILFVFLALRFDFGNDYLAYYNHFEKIKDSFWSDIDFLYGENLISGQMEFGYVLFVKLLTLSSNFYFLIALHSLFMCWVYYSLIKKNVEIEYAWLAVLIFVFLPQIMLVQLSAIRQTLAILCFYYSVKYLINRSFIKYLLCILIASTFHYSAFILIPIFFIITNKPVLRFESFIYMGLYIFIVLFGSSFLNFIQTFTESYLPKYISYFKDEGVKVSSGIGLIINSALYLFILFFGKTENTSDKVFYRIAAMYILFSTTGMILNSLSRLALYFVPALIIVVPQMMTQNINKIFKIGFISVFLLMVLFSFYTHFTEETYFDKYYQYKTIFSDIFY